MYTIPRNGTAILITADQCQMMAVQQFLIFSPIAASFTVAALAIFYIGRNKVPGELVKTGTSTS
ncbi:MAG: hypothetical protein AUF79_15310 [Crenarchaeota archaeon 13_1_20CM_2_51_8]|nr:MAG: hypothetical protein AUF79_15310 [Crenarchaeota archaeon 13_1_20CM_2_51_8]